MVNPSVGESMVWCGWGGAAKGIWIILLYDHLHTWSDFQAHQEIWSFPFRNISEVVGTGSCIARKLDLHPIQLWGSTPLLGTISFHFLRLSGIASAYKMKGQTNYQQEKQTYRQANRRTTEAVSWVNITAKKCLMFETQSPRYCWKSENVPAREIRLKCACP